MNTPALSRAALVVTALVPHTTAYFSFTYQSGGTRPTSLLHRFSHVLTTGTGVPCVADHSHSTFAAACPIKLSFIAQRQSLRRHCARVQDFGESHNLLPTFAHNPLPAFNLVGPFSSLDALE